MCLQPYGHMIVFYNIQIIYVIQTTIQYVCYAVLVDDFCIFLLTEGKRTSTTPIYRDVYEA